MILAPVHSYFWMNLTAIGAIFAVAGLAALLVWLLTRK